MNLRYISSLFRLNAVEVMLCKGVLNLKANNLLKMLSLQNNWILSVHLVAIVNFCQTVGQF